MSQENIIYYYYFYTRSLRFDQSHQKFQVDREFTKLDEDGARIFPLLSIISSIHWEIVLFCQWILTALIAHYQ